MSEGGRWTGGSFSQIYKTIVGISAYVGKRKTAVLCSWPPVQKKCVEGHCGVLRSKWNLYRIKLKRDIGLDTVMADGKGQKLNIQIHMLAHSNW